MKIQNSNISMTSAHEYASRVSEQTEVMEVRASDGAKVMDGVAAIYDGSGKSMVSAMGAYQAQVEEHRATVISVRQTLEEMQPLRADASDFDFDVQNAKKSVLEAMLELLNGKSKFDPLQLGELKRGNVLDLRGTASKAADMRVQLFGASASAIGVSISVGRNAADGLPVEGTTPSGTVWKRITAHSVESSEYETTTFETQGYAVTEDGRSFNIDVALNMSRAFTANYDALTSEEFIMTDPLIINLDSNVTSLSGAKFEFDLNSDGQREEISFAGEGSGFLALDANGNGVIDDGSELFGTQSGDGFADLAAYDEDGNGWIDENDSVYSELRVWTKDARGADKLLDLKEANVGAIYLGSAETEFSLKDADTNETQGVIRKTGVYLKETGETGTLSHVDLRC